MIEDILYGEIKTEGEVRSETEQLTEHVAVEYEITTRNGQDHYLIKSVTITSHSSMTVKVDDKTIVQPPPPYYDDGCYFRNKPMVSPALPSSYFQRQDLIDAFDVLKTRQPSDPPTRERRNHGAWGIVRNDWTPADFGHVGYPK